MFSCSPASPGVAPLFVGRPFSLSDLEDVARRGRPVAFCDEARARVAQARAAIDAIASGGDGAPRVYGVNTGFGYLAETRISAEHVRQLQLNLVRSHACGVGPALGTAEARAMILLRAQVLALGHSGVRVELVELLLAMLNRGVIPRIPSQGSVGASGDLSPLAHLALVLVGEGEVITEDGAILPGGEALARVGLAPLTLEAKEGLALINGTQLMAALGALAVLEGQRLCVLADIVGATSLEANKGTRRPFDERVIAVRPHPGAIASAANLRALLRESPIMESHAHCGRVQDAYSFRCMPQVHGASRDALTWAAEVLQREINSVTDNPLVFPSDDGAELISGGNFHGQPLALALDLAAIALAELANISERRVEQLVNPALSSGLPPFLAPDSGLQSGFMIAQVAAASLVSENKVLCHPASVDSIPSSAGKEDHVSMGSVSARKLLQVLTNVRHGLAIEAITAAAGVDLRAPLQPSLGVRAAVAAIRERVAPFTEDRPLHRDIEAAAALLASGALRERCEEVTGPLAYSTPG